MKERTEVDYDKELSMGNYIGKKIYETVVTFGSMGVGAWGGLVAASKLMPAPEQAAVAGETAQKTGEAAIKLTGFWSKIPGLGKSITMRQLQWGGGIGLFAGALVGGITLGYEHWKKVKKEQLQVDEVAKDVSDIEVFKKTDPELKAENQRLWAELNGRRPHGEGHASKQDHASWGEHVQAEHHEAHEAAR